MRGLGAQGSAIPESARPPANTIQMSDSTIIAPTQLAAQVSWRLQKKKNRVGRESSPGTAETLEVRCNSLRVQQGRGRRRLLGPFFLSSLCCPCAPACTPCQARVGLSRRAWGGSKGSKQADQPEFDLCLGFLTHHSSPD